MERAFESSNRYCKDAPVTLCTTKILIFHNQGTADHFADEGQLLVENFMAAAEAAGVAKDIQLRRQPGYNHSYYFMSTFADEHVDYAADALFKDTTYTSKGSVL